MSTAPIAVPGPSSRTQRPPFEAMLLRLLGVIGFMCIPTVISVLDADHRTVELIRFLAVYSPEKLVHGRLWTLVGSAFLLPRLSMVGTTSIFVVALFLPFALVTGALHSAKVFLLGHCFATLAVCVVVVAGSAIGWHAASVIYHHRDVGASAGLAACAGALCYTVYRRAPVLGVLLLAAVTWFFFRGLLWGHGDHGLSDSEHLLALGAGVFVERRWQ